ncbi:MAG: phosphatase domain-containing protein [Polyangiales bacterium]|nr:hypothetical protein [Myxococcales bacterium]MCB9658776.1 hypothetical protein [Sandaracinaceae bacterium]
MTASLDPHRVVYRWDLDKTYLRTEFDSIRDLLRTAVEPATRKRTVPGASVLLRELRATNPAAVYILSGSPEQMRRVLEAKLRLDGIRWDSFTLKPSLDNLLKGRFRVLKDQVSYKLEALLSARAHGDRDHREVLFGDDAEADAFIYSLYADLCAGRVDNRELMAVLDAARVYPESMGQIVRTAGRVPRGDCVHRVFIHLDRISSPAMFEAFGPRVLPFFNYFQPALVLLEDGLLDALACLRVGAGILLQQGFHPSTLNASFAELAAKGVIGMGCADRLLAARSLVTPNVFAGATDGLLRFLEAVSARRPELGEARAPEAVEIDYVELFSRDRERAHAAKRRARWRPPRSF